MYCRRKKLLPGNVNYFEDVYRTVEGADAIVLMTEWNEYRGLDFGRQKQAMSENVFVDLRNVYENSQMTSNGFKYFCIGR